MTSASLYLDIYKRLLREKAYDKGVQVFTKVIAQRPQDADAYSYRARFHNRKGAHAEALVDVQKALQIAPKSGLAHYVHGTTLHRMNDLRGAVAAYTRAIENGYEGAYNNRGVALLHLSLHRVALADFTRVLQQHPDSVRAYHNRGLVRLQAGDVEGAIADLTKATTKKPDYIRSYLALGAAYYAAGKQEEARTALCRYQLGKDNLPAEVQNLIAKLGGCADKPQTVVFETKPLPAAEPARRSPVSMVDTQPIPHLPDMEE